MIAGVVKDYEMTFTCDHFKIAWQNYDFDFKVILITYKLKNQVSDQGPS